MPSSALRSVIAITGLVAACLCSLIVLAAPARGQSGPPTQDGVLEIVTVNGRSADAGSSAAAGTSADGGVDGIIGNEISPGDEVTIRAGGYAAGAQVEVWLFSDPILLAVVTADSRGFIDVVVAIPEDAEVGAHNLQASGASPTGEVLTVTQAIEIPDPSLDSPATPVVAAAQDAQDTSSSGPGGGPIVAVVGVIAAVGLVTLILRRSATVGDPH